MLVFDDVFIDRNVYSGMEVGSDHRQNLHDLILGERGVALARRVDDLAAQIRNHNTGLREKAAAIPIADRQGLSIDEFCALEARQDIDEAIKSAEQRVAAFQHADGVRRTAAFSQLSLPDVARGSLEQLLVRTVADLDKDAARAVQSHFASLPQGAEEWAQTGMRLSRQAVGSSSEGECPFCDQPLGDSPIFGHYRAYFGEAYNRLQADVAATERSISNSLSGDALAGFQRQVGTQEERQRFWSQFITLPGLGIDLSDVAGIWQRCRDAILSAIRAKKADPLTATTLGADATAALDAYHAASAHVTAACLTLMAENEAIRRVKESVQAGNTFAAQAELNRLRATKTRYVAPNVAACDAYLQERALKEATDAAKVQAQQELDIYRATAVPNWETAVNAHLVNLGAGFSLARIQSQPTPGRPSCVYRLVINGHEVGVGPTPAAPGSPTFKNTLSAGDRNTLALAFFLASLDRDPDRAKRVVVFDDPMSSLDKHRRLNTIHELRTLLPNVAQVMVMSHDEYFLFDVYDRISARSPALLAATAALEVHRDGAGSTIDAWDIESAKMSRHDKRHATMTQFINGGGGGADLLPIAQCIRPHIEHFLRAAVPNHFRPGEMLRDFRNRARTARTNGTPIISEAKYAELDQIVEYSSDFHHDTNAAFDAVVINDAQLRNFVQRALGFVAL